MKKRAQIACIFLTIFIITSTLMGCGSKTPGTPPPSDTAVFSLATDPDTLDIQKSSAGTSAAVMELVGGSLLAKDPTTGEIIPYLAKSYKVSDDGKTLTFILKDGIKFHDGTPLTAEDYAWTFTRAMAPETASPVTAVLLAGLVGATATDTKTLVLTLDTPNFYILDSLTLAGYTSPYSKAYMDEKGDDFIARNPMSVGPYIFRQWKTGESIILDRNPDFTWGPAYAPGPRLVQTVEYKIIPDQATVIAALEAGETLMDGVPDSEISRFQDPAKFTIYKTMSQNLYPALAFNLNKEPWNNLVIRQALSTAIDRQSIIDVLLSGNGSPAYGPLPPSIPGYNPKVEDYYNYDKTKALALFGQAGYTPDSTGKLVKDGIQLSFTVLSPAYDFVTPGLQIVQEQLKALGIDMQIETVDPSLLTNRMTEGSYDLVVTGYNYPNAGVLYYYFHSSMLGAGLNSSVNDPQLDTMLVQAQSIMDPVQHKQVVDDIQVYIVENAYWITLVNSEGNLVVSTRVEGAKWSAVLYTMDLSNASIK